MSLSSFILQLNLLAEYSSVWYAFPIPVTFASSSMTSPSFVNPTDLAKMPNKNTDDTETFDMSLLESNKGDLNIDKFVFDPLPIDLDAGSGYDGGSVQGAASALNIGTANAFQPFVQQSLQTFPMQQPVNPSPAGLTPSQVLPTPPPGLAYHPQVGWYYPANVPTAGSSSGFLTPQLPQPQFPQQAMMAPFAAPPLVSTFAQNPPIPLFDETSAVQADTDKRKRGSSRVSPRTKRKYGPSAYLEEQAKRRAEGDDSGPRPVSRESIDFHYDRRSKSARTSFKRTANARRASIDAAIEDDEPAALSGEKMKELKTATMQKCCCPGTTSLQAKHIPRPRNEFMIFRNDFAARWRMGTKEKRGKQNPDISKEAGRAWQTLKATDKAAYANYRARAREEKALHEERYPDYKYTPLKKIQANFGKPSCECGAYAMNIAELQRLRAGAPTVENEFIGAREDAGQDGDADYVAPRTRSQSCANIHRAPTPQLSPFTFDQNMNNMDMPDFGFAAENQNATAAVEWAALQAFNASHDDAGNELQGKKRRSARAASKAVHYAEEMDEEDAEAEAETPSSKRKHRPSPISTSRKASSARLSSINSADFHLLINEDEDEDEAPGPASRTRSTTSKGELKTGYSNASSMRSLFGGGDDDDDDEIVVAHPKQKLALPPKRESRSKSRSQSRSGRKKTRS